MLPVKIKKWGGFLFRLAISFLLIYWLLTIVDIESTVARLFEARIFYILIAVAVFVSALVFFSLRWSSLLNGMVGEAPSLLRLMKYYFVGLFFNNFLPTSIGGDVIRAYYVSHDIRRKGESFASVVLERIFGFGLTALLSLSGILIVGSRNYGGELTYIVLFLILFVLFLILFLFYEPLFGFITGWFEKIPFFSIGEKLQQVFQALRNFREAPGYFVKALLLTAAGQGLIIVFNYLLFLSVASDASFYIFLFVVPLTMIASLFPSINGIGTRESAYVVLLGAFGIGRESALALAILVYIIPLFISILGGIFYIAGNVPLRSVPWDKKEGE